MRLRRETIVSVDTDQSIASKIIADIVINLGTHARIPAEEPAAVKEDHHRSRLVLRGSDIVNVEPIAFVIPITQPPHDLHPAGVMLSAGEHSRIEGDNFLFVVERKPDAVALDIRPRLWRRASVRVHRTGANGKTNQSDRDH